VIVAVEWSPEGGFFNRGMEVQSGSHGLYIRGEADPKATFCVNLIKLIFLVAFVFISSDVTADLKGPYVMTVDEVRESQPGPKWDPNSDEVLVQVRGYLRNSINLNLYATRDQALLDDISGILVSDEGEGDLRRNCSEGFVELIARLGWMETERRPLLIPTEAKKLILQEHRRAEEQQCWKTANTTDR
jgi:hypothetical protein